MENERENNLLKKQRSGRFKYLSKTEKTLCIGCLVASVCVIVTVFDGLKIPFYFLSDNDTSNFNNAIASLAISFLMGCLVYYLTVIRQNKINRKRRIVELYDFLWNEMDKPVKYIEDITNKRIDYFDLYAYKLLTKGQCDKFKQLLLDALNKMREVGIENILDEYELDQLSNIRKAYSEIEPYYIEMDEQLVEFKKGIILAEFKKDIIKEICKKIRNLLRKVGYEAWQ